MKFSKIFFLTATLFVFILGCNSEPSTKSSNSKSIETECTYSLLKDSSSVNWTAFKTNARVGVKGHFDEFKVGLPENVSSPFEAIVGTTFNIETKSVNTGDLVRDPKLVQFFFNALTNGQIINGSIKSADGNEKEGNGLIELLLNGMKKEIPYTYKIEGNIIYLKTGINLDEWNGSDAVKSLNTACYDLHTGEDGVSKLWPDIEIEVIAMLKKDC
jgi:hypothetical protein